MNDEWMDGWIDGWMDITNIDDDIDILELLEDIQLLDDINLCIPRINLRDRQNPLEVYSDEEIRRCFRFSKTVIIEAILPLVSTLNVTNRGCPLPPILQLLVALRFYGTGLIQIIEVTQSTVSRIIYRVSELLSNHIAKYIKFPDNLNQVKEQFRRMAGFPGVIGCVDGTHVRIKCPSSERGEIFRNRNGKFSINVQVVGGPDLKIQDIVVRWPGSIHDSHIFHNSSVKHRLETDQLQGILLGDSGYPQLRYLCTPTPDPMMPDRPSVNRGQEGYRQQLQEFRDALKDYHAQLRYNRAHKITCNSVEKLFSVWKRRFGCLYSELRTKLSTTQRIITATAVLHNIAIQTKDEIEFEEYVDDQPELDPFLQDGAGIRNNNFIRQYFRH